MEIAIPLDKASGTMVFVQVKRGFDTPTWLAIKEERRKIQNKGSQYLLISPTEYTNENVRREIWEQQAAWAFVWQSHCWGHVKDKSKRLRNDDWIEDFVMAVRNLSNGQ